MSYIDKSYIDKISLRFANHYSRSQLKKNHLSINVFYKKKNQCKLIEDDI